MSSLCSVALLTAAGLCVLVARGEVKRMTPRVKGRGRTRLIAVGAWSGMLSAVARRCGKMCVSMVSGPVNVEVYYVVIWGINVMW